jgi:predicted ATPase/DNA-binding SARP family transcriptional activator/Tfp pilus assembly protein PilF
MAKMLRLTLLGESSITLDGARVELPLAKAQGLLFYLAVTGRTTPRSVLVDLFWSELGPEDARRNLRVALTKLRHLLRDHLQVTRTTLALKPASTYWLDVKEFVERAQVGERQTDPPLATAQASELAAALALYQGDFLAGFVVANAPLFEEWVLLERERLHRLAIQTGDLLLAHYSASGDAPAGVALARRLLALEPWHENLHRQLMQLLAQSGQRTVALQQYELCRRILAAELGVEPEVATRTLYEQIRAGEMRGGGDSGHPPVQLYSSPPHPLIPSAPPHNLPAQTTGFVGRSEELAQITTLLADPGCRLLTLLGVGGIGKTRLALHTAEAILDFRFWILELAATPGDIPRSKIKNPKFPDGLFYVSLATVTTIAEAIPAMAGALGLTFAGSNEPKVQLFDFLRAKTMLLVLDNFEQLVPEATFLSELLQNAPGLKVLVTSRTRLDLYEEWIFDVRGLPFPASEAMSGPAPRSDIQLINAYAAIQLFVQRARRVRLDFDLAVESEAVIEICRLLEGMPLGIELAAGWVRGYPCAAIAHEIRRNLDFLATSTQNVPPRHRSLRAAFDHSWRFLPPDDAMLFKRLVIFHGGFDESAAGAVAGATPLALVRLADKSLLQGTPDGRYVIHELLRQYGLEKLSRAERHLLQATHCRYYGALVAGQRSHQETASEPQALIRLRADYDNIRAGWQWLVEQIGGLAGAERASDVEQMIQLVGQYAPLLAHFLLREGRYRAGELLFKLAEEAMIDAGWDTGPAGAPQPTQAATLALTRSLLADFAFNLSQFNEVERLIGLALTPLEAAGQETDLADALARLGRAYLRMGRYDQAEAVLQRSLVHYEQAGEKRRLTLALNALGIVYSNQGHFNQARTYYERCLAIFRTNGYQRGVANMLSNLGSNFGRAGRFAEALALYQKAHQIAQTVGERLTIAIALSNLGSASRALGHLFEAKQYYQQSLDISRSLGEQRWTAASLNGLALTLVEAGEFRLAHIHAHEALAIAQAIGSTPDQLDSLACLGEILARQNETVRAYSLLHFVAHHTATQSATRRRSQRLCEEIGQRIAPSVLTTAQDHSRQSTLAHLVSWVTTPAAPPALSTTTTGEIEPSLHR